MGGPEFVEREESIIGAAVREGNFNSTTTTFTAPANGDNDAYPHKNLSGDVQLLFSASASFDSGTFQNTQIQLIIEDDVENEIYESYINIGVSNSFNLNPPVRLDPGGRVRVYVDNNAHGGDIGVSFSLSWATI